MELLGEARDLVALVRRRKKAVTEAFDDIGEACVRLQDKATVAVLGRRSFAEVCEQDLALGGATARRLIAIVTTMTRPQALAMGQQKALAMVTLEEATPERDTPAPLLRKKSVAVPGGGAVSLRSVRDRWRVQRQALRLSHRRLRQGECLSHGERVYDERGLQHRAGTCAFNGEMTRWECTFGL